MHEVFAEGIAGRDGAGCKRGRTGRLWPHHERMTFREIRRHSPRSRIVLGAWNRAFQPGDSA